jgi:hypothetical protein
MQNSLRSGSGRRRTGGRGRNSSFRPAESFLPLALPARPQARDADACIATTVALPVCGPKPQIPMFSDCSEAQLPGPHSPNHRPECLNVCSTPVPEAFNTHRHDGRGSGLVQDVLRSLARIPAVESRQRGLCAAPTNVKRSTFPRVITKPVTLVGARSQGDSLWRTAHWRRITMYC